MVWYNVENLFRPDQDSLPADEEFTPEGLRHWTWTRYHAKLTALAKVIVASGGWQPPGLVGLCEVEGAGVLEDLISHPILEAHQYAYLHSDSRDHRGMDVACLYRPGQIRVLEWSAVPSGLENYGTRDMMHVCLSFGPHKDTLDVFLVHLVSKYGGAGATAEIRKIQAGYLIQRMDSVHGVRPRTSILVAGDFNDGPESYSLEPLRSGRCGRDSLLRVSPDYSQPVAGTYKYRGRWSHLDQIYCCQGEYRFDLSASVLILPPLITRDELYGGLKPKRTYEGYHYQGGLSDHLPLVLRVRPILLESPLEQ